MKIINGGLTTIVAFDDDYTEATLTRLNNKVSKVKIPAKHFSMKKLRQFSLLTDGEFIGLSDIQAKLRELRELNNVH